MVRLKEEESEKGEGKPEGCSGETNFCLPFLGVLRLGSKVK